MRAMIKALFAASLIQVIPFAATAQDSADRFRPAAARILGTALQSSAAYDQLGELCDQVGNRISGSERLDQAIQWAVKTMKDDGLQNVHTEKILVPYWKRGAEKAWTISPQRHELSILGLGMSVPTPKGGITADVVVVGSFDELDKLGEAGVKGKIVLYDVPFAGYGRTVPYRAYGPSRAAKYGAVAALVRSVGSLSFDTPHTGTLAYEEKLPKIPAAAVTIENATMLRRMARRGERIQLHLELENELIPDRPSANVVGEILGSEKPQEVVLLGGHLDSWDVGQGAQDDGVGCMISLGAVKAIHDAGLKPRRTLRVVFFTNEENGTHGGNGYRDAHNSELANFVAALESDSGNGPVKGFTLDFHGEGRNKPATASPEEMARGEKGLAFLNSIAPLLEPLDATHMEVHGSGTDVGPIVAEGVPGIGVSHDTTHYWEIHHTKADTFDKVVKLDMQKNIAAIGILAYVLADMDGTLR
ncbi:MAG: M20/M25/M40 family metallo-hydrolase [Acidobacteriota bacterium]|nr:M20/M25/M40 family metallo-hydrolase [Acidobacteriota bacterium]